MEVTSEFVKMSESFAQQLLDAHNQKRSLHQAPAMTLDTKLCEDSQTWAEHLASINKFSYKRVRGVGQSLAWYSKKYSANEIVKYWYDEMKHYDFSSSSGSYKTGHFTQLVWKNTSKFGAGIAETEDGNFFIVANYFVQGNIVGLYAENVLPKQ